jgi:hypothetical protein
MESAAIAAHVPAKNHSRLKQTEYCRKANLIDRFALSNWQWSLG